MMDKQTRNLIQKATQDARNLLESEFGEQLEGVFDILPNGRIAPEPGKHLNPGQCIIRKKLIAAIEHEKAGGVSDAEAVANYLREASFTCLNRFAALKMLEARGLVQECVSRGEQSSGFKEFCGLAPGLLELPDKGYRLYIESLFDELSTEIRVLFDRRDLASLLWPGRKAFDGLLNILNREEIAGIWGEDETIGWVYQYFNSGEERKKMRDASAAPRNSRELAVRNQFFTPRYVVEFLTDNTLGRIWYEMRQGDTVLKDECRYLVRRPNEVFLGPGEKAPAEDDGDTDLSQEELLKKTVYIEHRPKKDPRDIKILDPACGSGHFLLYAFDLLERIYEESWGDKELPQPEATGRMLREDYQTLENLRCHIPKLIIEHNLHGIDIDHRAVQIAALSLWMRAQRSWKRLNLKPHERPKINNSNVVTAEPMPGEDDMRKEFIAGLEPRLLGQLVEEVFKKMELAGEAGALLKIEEEIKEAVAEAKRQWIEVPEPEQQLLFPSMDAPKPKQMELRFDVKSVTEEGFWDQAEEGILSALRDYAERFGNGSTVKRRLFAEDAARGFAFVNLFRKQYDVVLMNPPFGDPTKLVFEYLKEWAPHAKRDLLTSFISILQDRLLRSGFLGAITKRVPLFTAAHEKWRKTSLLGKGKIFIMADLGLGVMDNAMVESCAYCISHNRQEDHLFACNLTDVDDRSVKLRAFCSGELDKELLFYVPLNDMSVIPGTPIAYETSAFVSKVFKNFSALRISEGHTAQGASTTDDFRFCRLRHEVPIANIGYYHKDDKRIGDYWVPFAKGEPAVPYFSDVPVLIKWGRDGAEVKEYNRARYGSASRNITNEILYGKPGIVFPRRTIRFLPRILPESCIFSKGGQTIFPNSHNPLPLLGLLSANICNSLLTPIMGGSGALQFEVGLIENIPIPDFKSEELFISKKVEPLIRFWWINCSFDETSSLLKSSRINPSKGSFLSAFKYAEKNHKELELQYIEDFVLLEKEANRLYGFKKSKNDSIELAESLLPIDIEPIKEAETIISLCMGISFGRFNLDIFEPDENIELKISAYYLNIPLIPKLLVDVDKYKDSPPDSTILVDDIGHIGDIAKKVENVFVEAWKSKSQDALGEIGELLNKKSSDLREWIRCNFFRIHVNKYSGHRRKAPIYWQLSTSSASYSVWLYYHRFTKDTFYQILNEFVTPKLQFEERELTSARRQYGASPTATQRKEIAARETFVAELKTFKEEVARIAPVWNPNLNDGVIINFAPLWRLVPQNRSWQKECKNVWDKLVKGDYDWAHLAMHLWPERVVPKCTTDRSLAIAHELDEILWEEDEKGKRNPKDISRETLENLIQERTSITVKAALEDLLNAPVPTGATRKKRKRKT